MSDDARVTVDMSVSLSWILVLTRASRVGISITHKVVDTYPTVTCIHLKVKAALQVAKIVKKAHVHLCD